MDSKGDLQTLLADTTLFIRNDKNSFVVAQIYVDDIFFGATNDSLLILLQMK